MTIYTLCRYGLLTKETYTVLSALTSENDFEAAESSLYQKGLTTSIKHARRLVYEIKKRILLDKERLPHLIDLIAISKSNLSSVTLGQIYFVFLYYSDEYVAYMTDKLGDIFNANFERPDITRGIVKTLLINYLQSNSVKVDEKTLRNWIGKYLSILREINFLIRKKNHEYFLNFFGIQPQVWEFFILHSYFTNYNLLDADFLKVYQLQPNLLPKIFHQFTTLKSTTYKMDKSEHGILGVEINTPYKTFNDWIMDVQ